MTNVLILIFEIWLILWCCWHVVLCNYTVYCSERCIQGVESKFEAYSVIELQIAFNAKVDNYRNSCLELYLDLMILQNWKYVSDFPRLVHVHFVSFTSTALHMTSNPYVNDSNRKTLYMPCFFFCTGILCNWFSWCAKCYHRAF